MAGDFPEGVSASLLRRLKRKSDRSLRPDFSKISLNFLNFIILSQHNLHVLEGNPSTQSH